MTDMIDDAFDVSAGPSAGGTEREFQQIAEVSALVEQAKGALIFRYSIGACAAFDLIERWACEARVGIEKVAHTLVHEICQGDLSSPSDLRLVRWLEERLRRELPDDADDIATDPAPVSVAVDRTDSSLDSVVEAARDASRRGVALEVTVAAGSLEGVQGAQLMQRIDLAVELARAVAPGLEVRLPAGHAGRR